MQYYNHNGKLVEYDTSNSKKELSGSTATAYFFDDYVFKKYSDEIKVYRINFQIFNVMRYIKNRHLAEIYELLICRDNYDSNMNSQTNFLLKLIDGYTMPIYNPDDINVLDKDLEYIFEMIYEFDQLIKLLTYMKILIGDVRPDNSIIQENNIILIDWDIFRVCHNIDFETLLRANQDRINTFFLDLFFTSSTECEESALFNLKGNISYDKSLLSQEIIKDLKKYRTMREYLHHQ